MLPEQSNNKKGLVLYICKNFPYIWEEHIVLLKNPHPQFVRETKLTVQNFIKKNKEAINFYINV